MKNLILILLFIFLNSCYQDKNQIPFDSNKWKETKGNYFSTDQRLNMTSDLLEKELLLNKSKSQIENIIGPPMKSNVSINNTELYLVKSTYKETVILDKLICIRIVFNTQGISQKVDLSSN